MIGEPTSDLAIVVGRVSGSPCVYGVAFGVAVAVLG